MESVADRRLKSIVEELAVSNQEVASVSGQLRVIKEETATVSQQRRSYDEHQGAEAISRLETMAKRRYIGCRPLLEPKRPPT